ncbi:JAB domain-containing protein [Acetatifactor muris]|uniref:JAB domain-containing protein n=1 Tax=Acetatifactor muris TaxID=879566 RepID=UPI0023F44563|nr:JAB domain-containing protein [Acetatifactor muris]
MTEEKDRLEVVSVRLVKDAPILSGHKIQKPEDAIAVLSEFLCGLDREVVCVINLKTDGTPLNCHFASMGSVNQSIACPRELFKSSILSNAANMILVHNHPSGTLSPSKQDTALTDQMIKLCDMMGIPLLDHVIVGGDNKEYFSFKEKELLKNPHYLHCTDYKNLQFESPIITERSR